MKKFSVCLDVGGTYIKGAIFSHEFEKKYTEVHYYPSKSEAEKEEIIGNLEDIILDLTATFDSDEWRADKIAIAFPGPFDYEEGICLIEGLSKFGKLHGVNLKEHLEKFICQPEHENLRDAAVFFKNDAEAFAYGENFFSKAHSGAYFTIGTGFGSTFIENRKQVHGSRGVPENGMIFNVPFESGIIDDYCSARGLKHLASKYYISEIEGKALSDQAKMGVEAAINVFSDFGKTLSQAIAPFIEAFSPEEIVFGGQISKSFEFFGPALKAHIVQKNRPAIFRISDDTTLRTLEGLFILNREEQSK